MPCYNCLIISQSPPCATRYVKNDKCKLSIILAKLYCWLCNESLIHPLTLPYLENPIRPKLPHKVLGKFVFIKNGLRFGHSITDVQAQQHMPSAYHLILKAIFVEVQSSLFQVLLKCISFQLHACGVLRYSSLILLLGNAVPKNGGKWQHFTMLLTIVDLLYFVL